MTGQLLTVQGAAVGFQVSVFLLEHKAKKCLPVPLISDL